MKKRFNLQELDCANCAAKMEAAIKKLDGVKDANVSFMAQKLTLEAEDGVDMEALLDKVEGCIKKVEPECILER